MKLKTDQTMSKHILNWYKQANENDIKSGLSWYADAQKFCEEQAANYNVDVWAVAQVVSILSPQTDWTTNKNNTIKLIEHGPKIKIFASEQQKENAQKALEQGYSIPLTAQKTYSFAENISDRKSNRVTVDRHAVNAALNNIKASPVSITKKQYELVENCYKKIAKQLDIKPYQLQAIVWVTYKRVVNR